MSDPPALTLDAGTLIGVERGDERMTALLELAHARGTTLLIPAGVLAQVWRAGSRQALLARLLADPSVEVVPLDSTRARAAGVLLGLGKTRDVVDASVVLCARERGRTAVVTSDPSDLARLDPRARLVAL